MAPPRLRLHHELLLLALHDQKGTRAFGHVVDLGLAGAVFTELLLGGRVRIVDRGDKRPKPTVEVSDPSPTGDAAMDAALAKLASARRPPAPRNAVVMITRAPKFWRLIAEDLVRARVVRESEDDLLLFFRRKVYPTLDPRPERALVTRVRRALRGTERPDLRTAALVGLADVTGTLAAIYDRKERRALRERVAAVRDRHPGTRATREAVEMARAAIAVAAAASH